MLNCTTLVSNDFVMKRSFLLCLLLLVGPLLLPVATMAQNNAAGIGISPAVIEKLGNPNEVITETVNVKNLSQSQQTYYIFTRDIIGVEGNGTPIFASDGQEKTGYEMSEWISLGTTEVTLEPDQETPVSVTITVPEFATPGSHFAGIFVSMDPPKLRSIGASVAYQVANIVSIRVAGDVVEKATIRQFATGNYFYGQPTIDFEARVENNGSTLIRPIGPLEIDNMFGKQVASLIFNESQGAIFPKATRNFSLTWNGDGPGFGRYEARLTLAYGERGKQSTISSTATFWILPANIILPALGVLAILLLVSYVSVRFYVRRKLKLMQTIGSRRISRRRRGSRSALLLSIIVMLVVTALFLLTLLIMFA